MSAQWETLLGIACDLIDQVNSDHEIIDEWALGGGTALMLQIGHRESDDIDIFLSDPQVLPYLDPARQNFAFTIAPSKYSTDGTAFLKIAFEGIGEIDFIVGLSLTANPAKPAFIAGRRVELETVAEIIAKKIVYRGSRITPRDIFDIAAAGRTHRTEIASALAMYKSAVEATLRAITASKPDFVTEVITQLKIHDDFRDATSDAIGMAADILREALNSPTPASET